MSAANGHEPPERMSRVRIGLHTPDGTALLRADTAIRTADLDQLLPVRVESGQIGRWRLNLLPDDPDHPDTGGYLVVEIQG